MKKKVLVVEANPASSFFLRYVLEGKEFDVECSIRGDDAVLLIDGKLPDIAIINAILPGISGVELCRRLRSSEKTENLPTILLVDSGKEGDRIKTIFPYLCIIDRNLWSGENIKRHIRTLVHESNASESLLVGTVVLNLQKRCIESGTTEFHLSPINFRLLQFFMKNPGQVLAREHLFAEIWEPFAKSRYSRRTVDVHVARLRKDLASALLEDPIRTARGYGYYFEAGRKFEVRRGDAPTHDRS